GWRAGGGGAGPGWRRAAGRRGAPCAGARSEMLAGARPLPPFAGPCPLMPLPLAFGTTPETFPAAIPYFTAAPDAVARWRARLATAARMKIGLVWAGHPAHLNDRSRSIALDRLAPLLELPGTPWYSLPRGGRAPDAAR